MAGTVMRWLHNLSVTTRRAVLRVILAVPEDVRARLAHLGPLVWVYEHFDRAKYQPVMDAAEYQDWVRERRQAGKPPPRYTDYRYQSPQRTPEVDAVLAAWVDPPLVSVLMPAWNSEPVWLRRAVASLQAQWYPHWELCIADDASDRADTRAALGALDDARIRITTLPRNGGIVAASNAALELARGEFVALLDHDDELAPDALFECMQAAREQAADFVYSDEDKLEPDGQFSEPHFKPDFAPDQLQAQNYLSHLGVIRRSLVEAVGGFSPGTDGAQDYDLYLKVCERSDRIAHVPRVLYHWRKVPGSTAAEFDAKSHAQDAGAEALRQALARRGQDGEVLPGRYPGTYRVRRALASRPLVSIVVPFRDQAGLTRRCLGAVLERSSYDRFEIIGIDNGSEEDETREMMEAFSTRDARVRFHRDERPFNFAALNNAAVARHAQGEQLVLMNNDIEVINADWLEALLEYAQREDVGVVGGCLYYPDGRFQHAGIILGIGGVAGHSHKTIERSHHGYFSRPHIAQNVSAVTAALWMTRRSTWDALGGLDEQHLAIAFNDVDYCLRAREAGLLNVYTPWCEAWHHESVSRGYETTPEKQQRFNEEVAWMLERHADTLAQGDPYYNPNLTLDHEDFSFAPPPGKPGRRASPRLPMRVERYNETSAVAATLARTRAAVPPDLPLPEHGLLRRSGPFRSGQHFMDTSFQNFRELLQFTGLQAGEQVLDYGCGLGRLAIPMLGFLDPQHGTYHGVDTDPQSIAHSQEVFGQYPHFSFQHVNLFSKMYNRKGHGMGSLAGYDLGGPYDLAFLFSVFTHVLPEDCDILLRVLYDRIKPGGRLFCSWFLLNPQTREAIHQGLSHRRFGTRWGAAHIDNPEVPEGAVAYEAGDAWARLDRAGFTDISVHFGMWRGNHESWIWQDVFTARRPG